MAGNAMQAAAHPKTNDFTAKIYHLGYARANAEFSLGRIVEAIGTYDYWAVREAQHSALACGGGQ
jgi:hypothetical protein